MEELKGNSNFRFLFAGGGPLRKQFEQSCQRAQITAAEFRPYSPKANLGESLGVGDIGLVTQRSNCAGSVVPSKIYGLLAAGRPILYIGPRNSTPAQLIRQHDCGWQVDCDDSETLVALLRSLASNRAQVDEAGRRARAAFLESYDLPLGVGRICDLLGATEQHNPVIENPVPEITLCTHL